MNFQIDHNLLHDIDNKITLDQWNKIVETVKNAPSTKVESDDVLYIVERKMKDKVRHSVYDNYDRFYSPGLDFVVSADGVGTLTVYNSSEQARAPITFEQGMQIAGNFFNAEGSMMSEEIVCEWVMDGNPSVL